MYWRTVALLVVSTAVFGADDSGAVLKAMHDELQHSQGLDSVHLEKPYFISYTVEDGESFGAVASLGGIIGKTESRFRVPRVQLRVGSYQFDNTNYVGSGASFGSRYDIDRFPLEDSYTVLRRYLWLATDQSYKAAVEALARKRAALKNMSAGEPLADFAHAAPTHYLEAVPEEALDKAGWVARVRSLSAIFAGFPQVLNSNVDVQAAKDLRYLVTSEGTEVRTGGHTLIMQVSAVGQAPDGMYVRDAAGIYSRDFQHFAGEAELAGVVRQVAENVAALAHAPVGETYNGPVLFEGAAAAQLLAELLGRNLVLTRKPVNEPGRPNLVPQSELEGRLAARVLPEWMDVVDDPTRTEWRGKALFGDTRVDMEGVVPKPLTLVEKGVLKNFLLTRQPVTGFAESNGRAQLPGAFGADSATISNLLVTATETVPVRDLKKQLIQICQARNQAYGILVRKLDFPSTAPVDELRRLMAANARDGNGGSHPVSLPILIYKVDKDGKEQLIRGVRFRELNVRSLRDIRAAGDDLNVLDYLENGAPMALRGAGSYAAEASVVAPSLLVDDLEVRKLDDELPKLPIVPSPLAGR
ncbi:MAG TPA: metallopeptidase TldD-related protein [Bryobacteraceae bacterium]|nr:metallopeptidase TldD-related protein [Bryobacteraceae bacterium]